MAAGAGGLDGLAEGKEQVRLFAGEDGGPGCVEQDVGDAGVAVEQDGDASAEGFDGD